MAKLIVRSENTEAEIEIIETEEGYGGTCSGVTGEQHRTHQERPQSKIFHHRFGDAIALAEIHMDVWHDKGEGR
jgi:hypothetical protein